MNGVPDIVLDDGTVLAVRPIGPADVDRLERMFGRLSPTTVHRRFFSPVPRVPRRMLEWLANVDHDRREALVALHRDEIVAVARYDGRTDSAEAEIAVTVEDAWQHRGVGTRLTRRLAHAAAGHGIERFAATMLPDNRPALGLLRKIAPTAAVRFSDGSYTASVPLRRAGRPARPRSAALRPPAGAPRAAPVGGPVDEAQARPGLVDRAHPVVHEPVREPDVAHQRLGQVGRDPGVAPRPRDPEAARRVDPARERREAALELRPARREEQHDVVQSAQLRAQAHPVGERLQRALEPGGRAHQRHPAARLDPELLHERPA